MISNSNNAKYFRKEFNPGCVFYEFPDGVQSDGNDSNGITVSKWVGRPGNVSIGFGTNHHSDSIEISKEEFDKEFHAALKIIRERHKE